MSTRFPKYLPIIMLGLALPGCSESVVALSEESALVGQWSSAPDEIGAHGWHQKKLMLGADGRFAATSAAYGLYEGQARNDPSAWTRIEGTFRVQGDRLYFTPKLMLWWDHFESPGTSEPRLKPYPWSSIFDDATFVAEGDLLRLSFNVFPADAPVEVTAEYTRADARD